MITKLYLRNGVYGLVDVVGHKMHVAHYRKYVIYATYLPNDDTTPKIIEDAISLSTIIY